MSDQQPEVFRNSQEKLARKSELEGFIRNLTQEIAELNNRLSNTNIQHRTYVLGKQELDAKVAATAEYQREIDQINLWFNSLQSAETAIASSTAPPESLSFSSLHDLVRRHSLLMLLSMLVIAVLLIVVVAFLNDLRQASNDLSADLEATQEQPIWETRFDEIYMDLEILSSDHDQIIAQLAAIEQNAFMVVACPEGWEQMDPSKVPTPCSS